LIIFSPFSLSIYLFPVLGLLLVPVHISVLSPLLYSRYHPVKFVSLVVTDTFIMPNIPSVNELIEKVL
jgi:hypothetical protein